MLHTHNTFVAMVLLQLLHAWVAFEGGRALTCVLSITPTHFYTLQCQKIVDNTHQTYECTIIRIYQTNSGYITLLKIYLSRGTIIPWTMANTCSLEDIQGGQLHLDYV